MDTESSDGRTAQAAALVSEALQRKADWAARISRIFLLVGGLGIAMLLISNLSPERGTPIDSSSPRAQRANALIESGRAIGTIMISVASLGCMLVSMRLARKWAQAATESLAQSAPENRRLLEITRAARFSFALFLRAAELELLRHERLTHKTVVILARKLDRQGASVARDFQNTAIAPQLSWWTQSAFGPMVGRHTFLRQLRQSIERTMHA